jgi:hypothetical protein
MSDMSNAALLWAVKGAGAVLGSAVSLAYVLPRGRREAAIRFGVGVASGVVFGSAAGLKIADELSLPASIGDAELMLMGSAAASFVAWWALGFVIRSLQRGSLTDFWKG